MTERRNRPTLALHYDKIQMEDRTVYLIAVGGIIAIPHFDWSEFPLVPVLVWLACLVFLALVAPGYAALFALAGGIGFLGALAFYIGRRIFGRAEL